MAGLSRRGKVWAVVCAVAVVLALSCVYTVGRYFETRGAVASIEPLPTKIATAPTVEYNGQSYVQRTNLTAILFMGIDKTSETLEAMTGYRNHGQADFLLLLVIDPTQERVSRLMIDRDTLVPITILGILGQPAGTKVDRANACAQGLRRAAGEHLPGQANRYELR